VLVNHTAGSRQYATNIWYKFHELIRKKKRKKLKCTHHGILGVYISVIKHNTVFSIKITFQGFQFLYQHQPLDMTLQTFHYHHYIHKYITPMTKLLMLSGQKGQRTVCHTAWPYGMMMAPSGPGVK
jgi:hypothetical protein